MARRPRRMAKEYVENFIKTNHRVDNGVVGKMYTAVLHSCKVLMKYPDYSDHPEIEMIKFQDSLIVKDPDKWEISSPHLPFPNLNYYLNTDMMIQNSKQLDFSDKEYFIQIGNNRFYFFRLINGPFQRNIKNFSDLPGKNEGKKVIFSIKNEEIKTIKEVQDKYFSGDIFLFRNLMFTKSSIEEVPNIYDYFSKSEIELIDSPIKEDFELFVNVGSYLPYFTHESNPEFEAWKVLKEKRIELKNKLEEKRINKKFRYDLSILKWSPGCEAISDNVNLYLKGPWEFTTRENKEFTETLSKEWYTVTKI